MPYLILSGQIGPNLGVDDCKLRPMHYRRGLQNWHDYLALVAERTHELDEQWLSGLDDTIQARIVHVELHRYFGGVEVVAQKLDGERDDEPHARENEESSENGT